MGSRMVLLGAAVLALLLATGLIASFGKWRQRLASVRIVAAGLLVLVSLPLFALAAVSGPAWPPQVVNRSAPVPASVLVYVSTEQQGTPANPTGVRAIIAMEARTGALRWRYVLPPSPTGGYVQHPLLVGSTLYIEGSGNQQLPATSTII